jgi:P2 family phage contractile tail tube protein
MSFRILRGFTLVARDQVNLALEIEEMKLPTLEEKSVDFTAGGATGETAVPLGITNKLEMQFKVMTHNPALDVLFGLPPGTRTAFTAVKSLFDDNDDSGKAIEVSIDLKARLMKIDPEQMKGGDKAGYDHMLSAITWYSEVHDGRVIREFNLSLGGWTILDGKTVNDDHARILRLR